MKTIDRNTTRKQLVKLMRQMIANRKAWERRDKEILRELKRLGKKLKITQAYIDQDADQDRASGDEVQPESYYWLSSINFALEEDA